MLSDCIRLFLFRFLFLRSFLSVRINILHWIVHTIHIRTDTVVFLRQRVNARPHRYSCHNSQFIVVVDVTQERGSRIIKKRLRLDVVLRRALGYRTDGCHQDKQKKKEPICS